jgi:hypothetical protein
MPQEMPSWAAAFTPRTSPRKRKRTSSGPSPVKQGRKADMSLSASQPSTSKKVDVNTEINKMLGEIQRLKGIIRSRDEKAQIDNDTIAELQTECNELGLELKKKEDSLTADTIRATMRMVSGITRADKGTMCLPHDMSASYRRVFQYGIPWMRWKSNVFAADWNTVEAERVGNHPEDPQVPKLTGWTRSYDHRPGDLAPPSLVPSQANYMPPPATRGPRGRGGRGGDRGGRGGRAAKPAPYQRY